VTERLNPRGGAARAARAPRRDVALGLTVLALLGLAAWVSTVAINGVPWSSPYEVRVDIPAGAPVLTGGDDVRIGGERVGQVENVSLAPGSRGTGQATLTVGRTLRTGASARIRPRGLAGAVYVDLNPGRGRPLPSDALIPATGSVQLTDVIAGFDASARQALQRTADGYGVGMAGRGETVGHVLDTAPGLLGNLTTTLRALRPRPGALAEALGGAATVAGALGATGALGQSLHAAAQVLAETGSHSSALRQAIDATPDAEQAAAEVLPSANTLLGHLSTTAHDLEPGVQALATALPSINGLERGGPAVTQFGHIAASAAPVFTALEPALDALQGPAASLTPLTTPIWTLAKVLIPYRTELIQAPLGFTRWGNFTYDFGTGAGHRAVRFTMVLTCARARDPYPKPGAAAKERKPCP
jgi:ABC-type transporter Mla subunit MlaD